VSIEELVKGCPLFYELYDEEIESILHSCIVVTFKDGQYIIKEGDQGKQIFIILNGKAKVTKNKAEGGELFLTELKKGDVFGEMVLINENKRSSNVVSHNTSEILVIEYDDIFSLFVKETKIFAVLLLNLARQITIRLNDANATIANNSTNEIKKAS